MYTHDNLEKPEFNRCSDNSNNNNDNDNSNVLLVTCWFSALVAVMGKSQSRLGFKSRFGLFWE